MFPRGGGIWDQDPILMQHFRIVKKFAKDWEKDQSAISESERQLAQATGKSPAPTGPGGLDAAMNQFLEHLEEDGTF